MEHAFWHEKWEQNQIGFHQPDVNCYLQQHWPKLAVTPESRVFVPMCGKSNDMLWLLDQGYQVVGVELSPLAVDAFFSENSLQAKIRQQDDFVVHEIDGLQIWCGDFFALPDDVGKIDAVYDRAALVALPEEMRRQYVAKMAGLLKPGASTLLITMNYPQQEMSGPPFSVSSAEVQTLYQHWCEVDLWLTEDALESMPQLKNRGLTQLQEQVYRLMVL